MTTLLDNRSLHLRRMVLDTLITAGRGHPGPALSLIEIMRVLYDDVLNIRPTEPKWEDRDRCILSKGHGCLALYAILADKGFFPEDDLKTFCSFDSYLGGHPEYGKVPGVEASTGALGHGLSIGVGLALSARIKKKDWKTYVIMGDGEINEGAVWEAAMAAGKHKLDTITAIIDYNKLQSYGSTTDVMDLEPLADKWQSFGFNVLEVDGHDVSALQGVLGTLPAVLGKPTALICHTVKGKGIPVAEHNPMWHHKNTLKDDELASINSRIGEGLIMRRVCLNKVHEMARRDDRVLYIGSDPGPGTLNPMKDEFPDRFFIEGIAEAHVIGMAAGMAIEGFVPYVNTIATFITRRCYEQIAVDLCMHNLPVRLIGNGGGYVYSPLGPTHQSIEDIAIMRALPNMTVMCVSDAEEMNAMMDETLDWPGPIYIRLGKGGDPVVSVPEDNFRIGKAIVKRPVGDVLIATTGVMVKPCLDAAEAVADAGISCGVLHLPTVKPLDVESIVSAVGGIKLLVTVEEHLLAGGLGSAILEALADRSGLRMPMVKRLGIPDVFTEHYGSQADQLENIGIDAQGIADAIRAAMNVG